MKTKSNFQQDSEVTLDLRLRLKPIFVVVGCPGRVTWDV